MDHRLQVGDTQLAPIEAPLGQRLQFGHNQGGRRGGGGCPAAPAQLGSILRLFWKVFNVINTEKPLNHINNNLE